MVQLLISNQKWYYLLNIQPGGWHYGEEGKATVRSFYCKKDLRTRRERLVHYRFSDFGFPASSNSLPLLVRSWERPFKGCDCEVGALSVRPSAGGDNRDWEGAVFVAGGPREEEGLASRWSSAFKAIALRKKIRKSLPVNKSSHVPPSLCLSSRSPGNLCIATLL